MLFYFTLFLVYLYFKVARVHKKEERLTNFVVAQHVAVAISAFALYRYGFAEFSSITILLSSFLFFIVVALMVTAVQVGIFVEGKPLFGVGLLFKLMPFLTGLVVVLVLLTLL